MSFSFFGPNIDANSARFLSGPFVGSFPIVFDTDDSSTLGARAIHSGAAGDVSLVLLDGSTFVYTMQANEIANFAFKQVNASGTTIAVGELTGLK